MAKKVKKPKNQKQVQAQLQNDFLKRLANASKIMCGEDLIKMMPSSEYRKLVMVHGRPIEVIAGENQTIPRNILKAIQGLAIAQLKHEKITIEETQKSISIYDYNIAGLTFISYNFCFKNVDYKGASRVKELIENSHFSTTLNFDTLYDAIFDQVLPNLIFYVNSFWGRYYTFSITSSLCKNHLGIHYQLEVKQHPIEKKKFAIGGHVRPAFRIGWTYKNEDFEWTDLSAKQLRLKNLPGDTPIQVYIQTHAISRLFERIDCFYPQLLIFSIYSSIRIFRCIFHHGDYLIECRILATKVGYFSASMKNGQLVIRTFLFLTFSGTPEGKRLETAMGLEKLDSEYLKMDKISSFMSEKLAKDETLRSIFENANCRCFIELYDKLKDLTTLRFEHTPLEKLASYIHQDSTSLPTTEAYLCVDEWQA
jgi:hypothetical protein